MRLDVACKGQFNQAVRKVAAVLALSEAARQSDDSDESDEDASQSDYPPQKDDGETEQRIWRITKNGEHGYEGQAEGVIGVAKGIAYGNALNWTYRFALKVDDDTWNVAFDDWLFLQSDGVLINRAEVTKLGFKLGEVTLVFRKIAESSEQAAAFSAIAAE